MSSGNHALHLPWEGQSRVHRRDYWRPTLLRLCDVTSAQASSLSLHCTVSTKQMAKQMTRSDGDGKHCLKHADCGDGACWRRTC